MSVLVTLYARSLVVIVSFVSLKYAYLVNRSIITRILSHFHPMPSSRDCGSFVMKSIMTSFYAFYGGGKGYSNPYGLCLSFLFIPHFTHALIMSLTLLLT